MDDGAREAFLMEMSDFLREYGMPSHLFHSYKCVIYISLELFLSICINYSLSYVCMLLRLP